MSTLWMAEIDNQLIRPLIDAGTRYYNAQAMAEFDQDGYKLEEMLFVASNYQLHVYVSFVAHCLSHKLGYSAMRTYIDEGDKAQRLLHAHVKRRQEVLDEIINTQFECDVHESTKQCPNPSCRKIGNFATIARQTRSADEGMRPQLLCNHCGRKFNA